MFIRTISLKSKASHSRKVVFTRYFPTGGTHTIAFEATGGGTHPLVRLDAFVVLK